MKRHRARLMIGALALAAGCATRSATAPPPPAPRAPAGGPAVDAIAVGQESAGRLTIGDPQFSDGSHYHRYNFTARQGDTVTFAMSSDDFDANLIVADRFGNPVTNDDDSGGDCNAQVTFVPRVTGPYRVYANSSARAELGAYRLRMRRGGGLLVADSTCHGFGEVRGLIVPGQTVTGELTADDPEMSGDSSYFQRWILPLTAGQTVTIDLTSEAFDAFLLVTEGRGDKLAENDDGGGGCNARIVYTATDDRPVRIVVNTVVGHATGAFTLQITAGTLPVDPSGDCPDGREAGRRG